MRLRYVTLPIAAAAVFAVLTACSSLPVTGGGGGGGGGGACATLPASIDVPTSLPSGCYTASDVSVNAPLTLAPGVAIAFTPGSTMDVYPGGSLQAVGTSAANKQIVFTSTDPVTPSTWGGIALHANSSPSDLEYVEIDDAGDPNYGTGAAVWVASGLGFTMKHAIIDGGGGIGLAVDAGGVASALHLQANTYRNNGSYPVSVPPDAVGALDPASSYSGNASHYVEVFGGDVTETQTWHMLAVPYLVTNDTSVKAALTLAAGVTVVMASDTSLDVGVGSPGTLTAVGSPTAGITIEKRPGINQLYWGHIDFESNSAANYLDYVTVEGGGSSNLSETAELYVQNGGWATIDTSGFSDSPAKAICWDGPSDQPTTSSLTYLNVDTTVAQYCLP